MTTYTVTNLDDSGVGSLRQADARAPLRTIEAAREAVFIDPGVPDIDHLTGGARSGTRAFVLDAGRDGLRQIAQIIEANALDGLAAIHIVSHGRTGAVQLGSTWLDGAALARHAGSLATIGAALAPGGGILLYGCDVARGARSSRSFPSTPSPRLRTTSASARCAKPSPLPTPRPAPPLRSATRSPTGPSPSEWRVR